MSTVHVLNSLFAREYASLVLTEERDVTEVYTCNQYE